MKRLPLATLAIFTASAAVYLAELAGDGMPLCRVLGFTPAHPNLGAALLSMWLHDPDDVTHVAGNLVALAVLGSAVEPVLGRLRFIILFLASGLGAAATHMLVVPGSEVPLVGASGGLCGLMAVGAVINPRAFLAFVATFIGMNLVGLFVTTPLVPEGVSVACHLGGFATGSLFSVGGSIRGVQLEDHIERRADIRPARRARTVK